MGRTPAGFSASSSPLMVLTAIAGDQPSPQPREQLCLRPCPTGRLCIPADGLGGLSAQPLRWRKTVSMSI
jgi:hypothetical protein